MPAVLLLAVIVMVVACALVLDAWSGAASERSFASVSSAPQRVRVPAYRIDIDRADVAELSLLPEIGPSLAARIAADRAVSGAFGSIDALARVEGIGPARLTALRGVATASGLPRERGGPDVRDANAESPR